MISTYYTTGSFEGHRVEIKKSKFYGDCYSVSSRDEALEKLSRIKELRSDASHHCYAYIIGLNGMDKRFSDDGEPGGTAGMPILKVMENNNIVNSLIVVTRYFGGTKLGAGGLVRAYSKTSAETIRMAGIQRHDISTVCEITIDYDSLDKVKYNFMDEDVIIRSIEYEMDVRLTVITRMNFDELTKMMNNLTDGAVLIENLGIEYHNWNGVLEID